MLITLLGAASVLSVSRWIEKYTSLNGEIEQKTALLEKAPSFTAANRNASPEIEGLESLQREADLLRERLEGFTVEESSGSYGFGEELLEITGRHFITVRRYRPLSDSGFTFIGSGTPENVIRLLGDISHDHPAWQFSGLRLTGSSRPGELDMQFDLENLSLIETEEKKVEVKQKVEVRKVQ